MTYSKSTCGDGAGRHGRQTRSIEGNLRQLEHRRAHVDAHTAVVGLGQLDHAALHLHAHRALVGQAALAHIAHEAARAVAAVLHLAAVRVVDDVGKIGALPDGGTHGQDLVRADTEAPIGQETVMLGLQAKRGAGLVQHHEVVACPLHLGKGYAHGGIMTK